MKGLKQICGHTTFVWDMVQRFSNNAGHDHFSFIWYCNLAMHVLNIPTRGFTGSAAVAHFTCLVIQPLLNVDPAVCAYFLRSKGKTKMSTYNVCRVSFGVRFFFLFYFFCMMDIPQFTIVELKKTRAAFQNYLDWPRRMQSSIHMLLWWEIR